MAPFTLTCVLLCAALIDAKMCCKLENYTLWTEMQDCEQCVAINTTICSGYCYTQDTNLKGRFGRTFLIQRGCMPHSLVYRTVRVPGCPDNVNPLLYYPEAQRCQCRRCDRRTHRCVCTAPASPEHCPMTPGKAKTKDQAGESLPWKPDSANISSAHG